MLLTSELLSSKISLKFSSSSGFKSFSDRPELKKILVSIPGCPFLFPGIVFASKLKMNFCIRISIYSEVEDGAIRFTVCGFN